MTALFHDNTPYCFKWKMTLQSQKIRAIPHKDCATDASSNFSSDETKSGVNTCCIHEHFCEIWESVSYLTYADCVVRFFERWREKRRKSFVDFRVFSRNISENMHARCVREDTKQALKGNLQADGVQSRQTLFVRYCLQSKNPSIQSTRHKNSCFSKELLCRTVKAYRVPLQPYFYYNRFLSFLQYPFSPNILRIPE